MNKQQLIRSILVQKVSLDNFRKWKPQDEATKFYDSLSVFNPTLNEQNRMQFTHNLRNLIFKGKPSNFQFVKNYILLYTFIL